MAEERGTDSGTGVTNRSARNAAKNTAASKRGRKGNPIKGGDRALARTANGLNRVHGEGRTLDLE